MPGVNKTLSKRLFERWAPDGHCHYCRHLCYTALPKEHPQRATMDHVLPLSAGGSRNWEQNIVIACYRCNQAKESLLPIDLDTNEGRDRALGLHNFIAKMATMTPLRRIV